MPLLIGIVMIAIAFWGWMILSDPYFTQPLLMIIAAGTVGLSVAGILYYRSLPAYAPAGDASCMSLTGAGMKATSFLEGMEGP
nr:hypothetical protein [Sphingomonas sp. CDS-1]